MSSQKEVTLNLFNKLKEEVSLLDPVAFAENHLTVDGKPFRMSGTGWKFMADLYREVAAQANNEVAKPMVILKGRQIGATVLAAVLSLYFTASGLYGTGPDKPPMRVLHVFPTLGLMSKYAKDKLGPMVAGSQGGYIHKRLIRNDPNAIKVAGSEEAIAEKTFIGYNKLRIESTGAGGDRIRGLSQDAILFDECFVGETLVQTESGKLQISALHDGFESGQSLPRVLTINEDSGIFEYKPITKTWNRGLRDVWEIRASGQAVQCTDNHTFLTARGWVRADNLVSGDQLIGKLCSGSVQALDSKSHFFIVESVVKLDAQREVYDISVLDNHNFLVSNSLQNDAVGGIVVSNCQDFSREAIETAGPILTSAQYGPKTKGIQLYFGTPKGTNSHFYNIWQKSDQRYFQLKCIGCQEYFYLYKMGDDSWKKIWISGHDVKCPICGAVQKKADAIEGGRWLPSRSGDYQYVGYHVSVLLHPWFTRETINDLDPSVNKERSEKAWKNETLGEFYSGGNMTLSLDDIRLNCYDGTRGLARSIIDRGDKTIVMGIDWGGKNSGGGEEEEGESSPDVGQSYTAVVIMSVDKNGVFTIENAYRLKRNDFEYKVNIISEMFRLFKVQIAVADLGYGHDIVQHMQGPIGFGERFLGCINSGNLSASINYKPKELRVTMNKDAMIEEIFSMVKKGRLRFPVQGESYDRIEWLMQHFTSMEVKRVIKNDNVYNKYVKGAMQNDGLMAAIYAMIAYKFLATSGFKDSGNASKTNPMPKPVLAYLPRM